MNELTMHAKGFPLNRSARKQKMELLVDPSEDCFLSRATAEKTRIEIVLTRENMPPIVLSGIPIGLRLRLHDVQLEDVNQIGLLEFLINDDEALPCAIDLAYRPEQDDLPWDQADDTPAAERIYTVDADGFVVDPIEQPIDVPDFLKVECKLLFAHIEGKWYYGYEIKGRIERSRRVNTLRGDGVSDLTMCLRLLWDSVKESLHGDISRLAEFIDYKIQVAIEAVQDKGNDLAEAMAQEIRLPADFLMGKTAEDTEIAEKTTEEDAVSVPPSCPSATSATSAVTPTEACLRRSEVMVFKAMRLKQAFVTITLQNRDDGWWRAGYEWQVGNATDGERVEAGAWYRDKRMCMQDLLAAVVISMASMQISGTADARRSMESRRNMLREQFEDWLEEKIDEAESEAGQDSVPFEEDVK